MAPTPPSPQGPKAKQLPREKLADVKVALQLRLPLPKSFVMARNQLVSAVLAMCVLTCDLLACSVLV